MEVFAQQTCFKCPTIHYRVNLSCIKIVFCSLYQKSHESHHISISYPSNLHPVNYYYFLLINGWIGHNKIFCTQYYHFSLQECNLVLLADLEHFFRQKWHLTIMESTNINIPCLDPEDVQLIWEKSFFFFLNKTNKKKFWFRVVSGPYLKITKYTNNSL